jgi:hypothetical protein
VRGSQAERGPGAGIPIDVGAIIEQVHFAFRQSDGAWRGGHTTYEATVHEDGSLELVPYHHTGGRAAGLEAASAADAAPAVRTPPDRDAVVQGSGVRFAPSRVERGAPLATGGGVAALNGAGQLEITSGAVVEQLRNAAEGVEQSWQFARRPEGGGDLEVRVALAAGRFAGETEGGLHFTSGELGVRYGHGTWIDGMGVETAVPARWDGGAVVLRVPHAVVEGSVYPAVLDPIISPELEMDAPVYGPAINTQDQAALALGGTSYLVVWRDYRGGTDSDVIGTRVRAADGSLLDAGGLFISTAADAQELPAVSWDGSDFLVVWQDLRAGNWDIYCARVRGSDGAVLDPDGRAVASSPAAQANPAVAWDGTNHLVVWEEYDGTTLNYDIYGRRLSGADASPVDAAAIPISTAGRDQEFPALAWDGTNYLVVWHDYRGGGSYDIYGARVKAADGAVLDAAGFPISAAAEAQMYPAVAWDGADYLVVWQDLRSRTSWDVYGARVHGADRSVLEAGGVVVSAASDHQQLPDVAWDGTDFLVVWQDRRSTTSYDIYGSRVGADGAVRDGAGIPIATPTSAQSSPAVAWDGTNAFVVWEDDRTGKGLDVFGARVSGADASVLDPDGLAVSDSSNLQYGPAVAWDGANYLIAWADRRSTTSDDIYACRVSGQDGSLLDPAGIAVSTAAQSQSRPAVAWGGTHFLVAWEDYRSGTILDVYAARVNGADGAVLDPAGILVSAAAGDQSYPAVAWDGANYLVVWEDYRSTTTGPDAYGARVRGADGVVLDVAGIPISTDVGRQTRPAVAWDGTNYLVVWQVLQSGAYEDIYGVRVSGSDGAVVDAAEIPISTAYRSQLSPAIAWDGTDYLVVWQDRRNGNLNDDVYGARVSATDGVVLDTAGLAISTAAGGQTYPAVAWDGQAFLVAWQDTRNGTLPDVYGARVTAAGVPRDAGGFLVSGSPTSERNVAIASPGAGSFLVVYDALDPRPSYGITRVKARSVTFMAPVAGAQAVSTSVDAPLAITLTATDADGDPLTYAIATQPAHGTLTGTGASRTYAPAAGWTGSDSFTFTASDGIATSAPATVSITVTAVNAAPVADAQSVTTAEDTPVAITLTATDADGNPLTYAIATEPAHGTLTGTGASRTYAPAAGYSGPDAFTFTASDGIATSAAATVSITVTAVNSAPVADAQSVTTAEDAPVAITLTATDADGNPLTYAIATEPAHGTLTGTGASRTYAPAAGYSGPDAFTFTASDGIATSALATVSITVTAAPPPPAVDEPGGKGCSCGTGGDATPLAALLLSLFLRRARRRC